MTIWQRQPGWSCGVAGSPLVGYLFALYETGLGLESSSLYRWAPKGLPLYAQANWAHTGVNAIGAAETLKGYKPCYAMY